MFILTFGSFCHIQGIQGVMRLNSRNERRRGREWEECAGHPPISKTSFRSTSSKDVRQPSAPSRGHQWTLSEASSDFCHDTTTEVVAASKFTGPLNTWQYKIVNCVRLGLQNSSLDERWLSLKVFESARSFHVRWRKSRSNSRRGSQAQRNTCSAERR